MGSSSSKKHNKPKKESKKNPKKLTNEANQTEDEILREEDRLQWSESMSSEVSLENESKLQLVNHMKMVLKEPDPIPPPHRPSQQYECYKLNHAVEAGEPGSVFLEVIQVLEQPDTIEFLGLQLGEGGASRIYLSSSPILKDRICIKAFVWREGCSELDAIARLYSLAKHDSRASRLVTVHGAVYDDVGGYLILGLAETDILHCTELINNVKGCIVVMAQMLEALSLMHEHGLKHGDIKPHNILKLKTRNSYALTDFGVTTESGQYLNGTKGYVDYYQHDPETNFCLTPYFDIYGLALSMLQMVFGLDPQVYTTPNYTGRRGGKLMRPFTTDLPVLLGEARAINAKGVKKAFLNFLLGLLEPVSDKFLAPQILQTIPNDALLALQVLEMLHQQFEDISDSSIDTQRAVDSDAVNTMARMLVQSAVSSLPKTGEDDEITLPGMTNIEDVLVRAASYFGPSFVDSHLEALVGYMAELTLQGVVRAFQFREMCADSKPATLPIGLCNRMLHII